VFYRLIDFLPNAERHKEEEKNDFSSYQHSKNLSEDFRSLEDWKFDNHEDLEFSDTDSESNPLSDKDEGEDGIKSNSSNKKLGKIRCIPDIILIRFILKSLANLISSKKSEKSKFVSLLSNLIIGGNDSDDDSKTKGVKLSRISKKDEVINFYYLLILKD
jgi:hypothetical protein